jgi:endonuclease YncB( thermonuclease family)
VYAPDGRMVNEEMVREGYALLYTLPPNVRHVDRIRAALEEARAERRGLWATSAFECPPGLRRVSGASTSKSSGTGAASSLPRT